MTDPRAALSARSLVAVALTLSGCGSSGEANASTHTSTSSTGTTTSAPTPTALRLGTAYTAKDGSVTLTVERVKSNAYDVKVTHAITPAQVAGAWVKGCVASGDGRFSWDDWTAGDGVSPAFLHYGPTDDQPVPHFPAVISDPVPVGTCATGWVYFEVAKGATITSVTWTHGTDTTTWSAS
jgi:hypothetical protein